MSINDDCITDAILALAIQRGPDKTACPSEVARALDPQDWRSLMPRVTTQAKQLTRDGRIEITQKGFAVDPDSFKGVWRIRLKR